MQIYSGQCLVCQKGPRVLQLQDHIENTDTLRSVPGLPAGGEGLPAAGSYTDILRSVPGLPEGGEGLTAAGSYTDTLRCCVADQDDFSPDL